jgi:uncharacterized protein YecE (DUF72 family)
VTEQLDLLADKSQRPEWLETMRDGVKQWAAKGVYFGGSSWKYEGWIGQVYTADRYRVRGKVSQKGFEKHCLEEYAEWYPTVCGDFAFYTFYADKFWAELFSQVPSSFRFGFKAPERVTAPFFPNHPRYGAVAGQMNQDFLNADLFASNFVARLAPYRDQVGYVVLEFPQFSKFTNESRTQFLERLDGFLGKLPKTLRYAVEIRTKKLLGKDYFGVLRHHNVAHTFNSWTRMPAVGEQLDLPDSLTADFSVARLLLRPDRTYEQAVSTFQPYTEVKDPYPEGYRDAARLIRLVKSGSTKRIVYLAVNNRYVGNTHVAINEIIKQLEADSA